MGINQRLLERFKDLKEIPTTVEKRLGWPGSILIFTIPRHPVGQEHEGGRKGGGRRTEPKTRSYMEFAGWHAIQARSQFNGHNDWPYEKDVWLDLNIYYGRKHPRPDPENVAAALQDAFTPILWKNDINVLPRVQYTWWPGKNAHRIPAVVFENGKYTGGVLVCVSKV